MWLPDMKSKMRQSWAVLTDLWIDLKSLWAPIHGECRICGFDNYLDADDVCDECFLQSLEDENSEIRR